MIGLMKMLILANIADFLACFWPVSTLVLVFKALNEYICPSSDLIDWDWLKNSNNSYINWKMLFLAISTHFWPVFDYSWSLYGRQILVDSVFTTALVRFNSKTQPRDNSGLQVAKECIFTQKLA